MGNHGEQTKTASVKTTQSKTKRRIIKRNFERGIVASSDTHYFATVEGFIDFFETTKVMRGPGLLRTFIVKKIRHLPSIYIYIYVSVHTNIRTAHLPLVHTNQSASSL